MAVVIVALAAIAVAMVHIRRREVSLGHQTQRLQSRRVDLRRKLWDQQVRLGRLAAPRRIHRRMAEMELVGDGGHRLAGGGAWNMTRHDQP